jgi:hypothetical protein
MATIIACTKDINIDVPEPEKRLVINSTIAPFIAGNLKSVYVDVSSSIAISDTTHNPFVKDAVVCLYSDSTLIDTLVYGSSNVYFIDKFWFPEVGKSYRLVVQHADYPEVTATTYIPSSVPIIDTLITPIAYFEGDNIMNEVAITFTDPVSDEDYYEVAISNLEGDNYKLTANNKLITREAYYPTLERFDLDKPTCLPFSDEGIDGQTYTLHLYYSAPRIFDGTMGDYMPGHFVLIHFRHITKAYYHYKTTLIQQLNNKEVDILYGGKEPLNVESNIKGGYGLFSGFNHNVVTMYVNEIDY